MLVGGPASSGLIWLHYARSMGEFVQNLTKKKKKKERKKTLVANTCPTVTKVGQIQVLGKCLISF